MTRTLTVFQPLPGDPADAIVRFRADPGAWLPGSARPNGVDRWRTDLRFGRISRPALCELGEPWLAGTTWWRRMRWLPMTDEGDLAPMERLLPVLDAELGLIADAARGSSLVISGSYEVPAAWVGEAVDALGLNRVARRTAATFLAEVAGALAAVPAIPSDVPTAG